jgi:hypothetical protein
VGKLESIKRRGDVLPRSLPPLGVNRAEAAALIGVSATKFDEMVKDGRMPGAKKIDGRLVWSVRALTQAFDALPDGSQGNPWDKLCGLSSRTGPG